MTMTQDSSSSDNQPIDTGLAVFVLILQFYEIPVDRKQLAHQYGNRMGVTEMMRCAKDMKLKARIIQSDWDRLAKTPLPAIAELKDGSFLILGKTSDDKALIHNLGTGRPKAISRQEFESLWSGKLVLLTRRASLSELVRHFDITWFLQAMYKYRHLLIEVFVASFFLQIFALVSPLFFQVVIDKVLVHRGMTTLDVLIFGLIAVSLFESILTALRTYVFSHTTNRIDVELGARLFRHLVALPIAYFEARRVGDSIARVRELENIRNFLTSSALTLVIDLFFTFVFLVVMAFYSIPLTAIVLASFPLYILISVLATPVFRERLNEKFNRGAENQSFLVETVTGIETLKALAVEPQMQRRWEEQLAGYVHSGFRVSNLGNWTSQSVLLVSKIVTAVVLFFGAQAVINNELSIGELVAFNMLAARVAQPVLRLAQVWQEFHQTKISIDRLGDILNTHPEPLFTPGRTALPDVKGNISFEHVGFRYKVDGPEILHDININIPVGQVVGIVGPSGSGKSTFAKLVQRLYVPEEGRILVDGVDLAMIDVSWLRRQIGVVLQENVLFSRSIRDNIALAKPSMPTEQVIAAAKLAGAHDFILELPDGYDSHVDERGTNLSGGQRQRIAIARARHQSTHSYFR
jgi:subfamily B ATP-binding cassette protein HlyB/CyaB